jgi:hypothetical protein
MNRTIAFLMFLALAAPIGAQMPAQGTPSAQATQMKKLDFLIGKWKGNGYVEYVPGQRGNFSETEDIEVKLGGLVDVVEGTGTSKMQNGSEAVTHSALAIVSYDESTSTFRWHAYSAANGSAQYIETAATVGDKTLEWGYQDSRAGSFRFSIKLDEKGQWSEIGEMSHDGKTWQKFFEMTLQRVP